MILDGDYDINVDMDNILSLPAELDVEDCMYIPSLFHMREYYVLKSQGRDPDTPTYMEALSDENAENTSMQWMRKLKLLREGPYERFF